MHVGVKKPVAQSMAQEALDHIVAELRQIEAFRLQRSVVAEPNAVDPFKSQHFTRGAIPIDCRHAKVGILAGVLRHLGSGGRFQTEIHFDCDRAGEGGYDLNQAKPPCFRRKSLRLARCEEKSVEIGLEAAFNTGPKDFHRHRLARAVSLDLGAMHLRDRSRSDRRPEAGVDRRKRLAKGGDDGRFCLALRKRRHFVLKAFQIACDRRADHVRPRRKKLTKLDVSGAKLGKCGGQPAFAAFCAWPLQEARDRNGRLGRQR